MRERKEVVRTALKGTFWLYLTYGKRDIRDDAVEV